MKHKRMFNSYELVHQAVKLSILTRKYILGPEIVLTKMVSILEKKKAQKLRVSTRNMEADSSSVFKQPISGPGSDHVLSLAMFNPLYTITTICSWFQQVSPLCA
jgi:hypothetical protein